MDFCSSSNFHCSLAVELIYGIKFRELSCKIVPSVKCYHKRNIIENSIAANDHLNNSTSFDARMGDQRTMRFKAYMENVL